MANFNRVILVGNITRDPEIRYTPSGTAVAQFGLAVNRTWRSQDGESREEVCFIDITAWARQGEVISEHLSKGDPILIEGRLKMESWQGQDGQKRTKHIVVVENFQFLGRAGRREGPPGQARPAQNRSAPARLPEASGGQAPAPEPAGQNEPDNAGGDDAFGGDDIPF